MERKHRIAGVSGKDGEVYFCLTTWDEAGRERFREVTIEYDDVDGLLAIWANDHLVGKVDA